MENFRALKKLSITDASYKTSVEVVETPLSLEEIAGARRLHAARLAELRPERVRGLARAGKSVLEAKPEPEKKSAKYVVRIYYKSEGGELLCVDSEKLTYQAADALEGRLSTGFHRVADARRYEYSKVPENDPRGARKVVFPSQVAA